MIEAPDGGAGGGWLVHTVAFYLGQWRQVQITGTRSGGHHRSITMSCPLPATRLFILPYHTTRLVSYLGSIGSSLCVCGCWLVPQWKIRGIRLVQSSKDENLSGPYVY